MRNKLDLFLKEIGLHLSPLQKKILEKTIEKKESMYVVYPKQHGRDFYKRLFEAYKEDLNNGEIRRPTS